VKKIFILFIFVEVTISCFSQKIAFENFGVFISPHLQFSQDSLFNDSHSYFSGLSLGLTTDVKFTQKFSINCSAAYLDLSFLMPKGGLMYSYIVYSRIESQRLECAFSANYNLKDGKDGNNFYFHLGPQICLNFQDRLYWQNTLLIDEHKNCISAILLRAGAGYNLNISEKLGVNLNLWMRAPVWRNWHARPDYATFWINHLIGINLGLVYKFNS
jgi:hypothetical protein